MEKVFRENKSGDLIKGIGLPAFIRNGGYHCALIKVYEDGMIDCWELVDFQGFVEKVKEGWVATMVPQDEIITRHQSFFGKATNIQTYIDEYEFIKEVEDTINELQKRPTSSERCRIAFKDYLKEPTKKNREKLRIEYKSIPEHLKRYVLGDMDSKDQEIKSILNLDIVK